MSRSAIWCWCQIQHPEKPVPSSVTDLLHRVTQHEDRIANGIKNALENPPPSVSDVSESMEDLEVERADRGCCEQHCEESDCCRKGETMDSDFPHRPQRNCSGSTEDLHLLLQCCVDVVSELGMPQELIGHIEELRKL